MGGGREREREREREGERELCVELAVDMYMYMYNHVYKVHTGAWLIIAHNEGESIFTTSQR